MSEINNRKTIPLSTILKTNMRSYSMFLMLAIILCVFGACTGGINLSARNVFQLFVQNSYVLVLAVGMLMVIVIGNIDLSVGSIVAFVGAISVMLYNTGIGLFMTIFLSLVIGLALGAILGFLIAYLKIPAFIVTLGAMLMFRGFTYIITKVTPITPKDDAFKELATGAFNIPGLKFGNYYFTAIIVGAIAIIGFIAYQIYDRNKKMKANYQLSSTPVFITKLVLISVFIGAIAYKFAAYRGIPTVAVILGIVVVIFSFLMKNTIIGRYIYAVGGNAKSAKLSGINSEQVTFIVHAIMGLLCGLAGVIFSGYMNSALPQAGQNFEMDAISACYIGGAATTGGIGTVIGAIVGGLVMASINNGMSLMNIQAAWQYVVKAAVLLFAVWYDIFNRRRSGLN